MGEYDIDNVNDQQEVEGNGSGNIWIWTTIGLGLTTVFLGVKNIFTKNKLNNEREKNTLYQKALKSIRRKLMSLKARKREENTGIDCAHKFKLRWRNSYGKI